MPGADSTLLMVRVTPRSSRDEVNGWAAGVLEVRVRAAPADGKANQAVIALLARRLDIPRARVEIVSGHTARTKRVRVDGMNRGVVLRRLGSG